MIRRKHIAVFIGAIVHHFSPAEKPAKNNLLKKAMKRPEMPKRPCDEGNRV
jgi:hypothetical protein